MRDELGPQLVDGAIGGLRVRLDECGRPRRTELVGGRVVAGTARRSSTEVDRDILARAAVSARPAGLTRLDRSCACQTHVVPEVIARARERYVAEHVLPAGCARALAALLGKASATAIALRPDRSRVERLVRDERSRARRAGERLGRPVEDRPGEELVRLRRRAAVGRAQDGGRWRARVLLLPAILIRREQRFGLDV